MIFITAYDSCAVRAFEVHAVDHLLKPFSAKRLDDDYVSVRTGGVSYLKEQPLGELELQLDY